MYVNENPFSSKVNYIFVKLSYLDFKFNITSVVQLCNNVTLKMNVFSFTFINEMNFYDKSSQ